MRGAEEIASADVRQSAITSHSIGVPQLTLLLDALPDAELSDYKRAVVEDNVLALATEWRLKTLRHPYLLRPDSLLFRALRDLRAVEDEVRWASPCGRQVESTGGERGDPAMCDLSGRRSFQGRRESYRDGGGTSCRG